MQYRMKKTHDKTTVMFKNTNLSPCTVAVTSISNSLTKEMFFI